MALDARHTGAAAPQRTQGGFGGRSFPEQCRGVCRGSGVKPLPRNDFWLRLTKPYEFIGFGAMDVTKPYE